MRYRRMLCRRAAALLAVTVGFAASARAGQTVPLEILEPSERTETVKDIPVSLGLIFPEGELPSAPGGAVLDDRGKRIPFEAEATGWWSPEKDSVKWLLLHFTASSDRGEQGQTISEMCRLAAAWGYEGIEFRRKRASAPAS